MTLCPAFQQKEKAELPCSLIIFSQQSLIFGGEILPFPCCSWDWLWPGSSYSVPMSAVLVVLV
jgi:hypothetical protein